MATTYRRRHNLLTNTLGATLATTATSITFGSALQEGGSNIATLATDEYLALTIGSEVVYLSAYTAGATTGTVVRSREGTADPGTTYASGLAVTHAPTRGDWPTAKGGLIIGSGTNQAVEKAVGADGTRLIADAASAGGAKWGLPAAVGCRAYRSAALTLANNGQTAVALDAETFDPQGMHDNATNNSRLTVPTGYGGIWFVTCAIGYAASATGVRDCSIAINGSIVRANEVNSSGAGTATYVTATDVFSVAAGDYFELSPFQNSGGTLAFSVGTGSTFIAVSFLGA